MAINKNHEFEELNGVKCSIVEKDASAERVKFLQELLSFNGYTVVVAATPPPKAAPAPKPPIAKPTAEAVEGQPTPPAPVVAEAPPPPPPPSTFTVGVSNIMFNPTNAVFGRQLKTPGGHIVSPAYWQQKEAEANDEIPYFQKT